MALANETGNTSWAVPVGGRGPEGNFFEDFTLGRRFRHATHRTITDGDTSLYIALTGGRQPMFSSTPLALSLGYRARPADDILVFNIAFGKSVPDISFNAIANLGYSDVRFIEPVYVGDTLRVESQVLGLRETSSRESGVVYVRSDAYNQHGRIVLSWVRWVLVRKRRSEAAVYSSPIPDLPAVVPVERLVIPPISTECALIADVSGSTRFWEDYADGDGIDHPAGMTIEESDHMLATRLYQNPARAHFDALAMSRTPHGRRLVYGGHVISVCRALSFDGLENALGVLAINGGSHLAPTFAGDTIYAFTRVLERIEFVGRRDVGALRLRLLGVKNRAPAGFSEAITKDGKPGTHPDVVLDLDYTVLIPRAVRPAQS